MPENEYVLYPLGFLQSPLKEPGEAPRQGCEGAPDAWFEVNASVAQGLEALAVGDEIIVITWLHKAQLGDPCSSDSAREEIRAVLLVKDARERVVPLRQC